MRALKAILITVGLLLLTVLIGRILGHDDGSGSAGILVLLSSLWMAWDSTQIQLRNYKTGMAAHPVVLFLVGILLWVIVFPCYLWARMGIQAGDLHLKPGVKPENPAPASTIGIPPPPPPPPPLSRPQPAPVPAVNTDWYFSDDGSTQMGPVEWSQIVAHFQSGKFSPETLLWAAHLSGWTPLKDFLKPLA